MSDNGEMKECPGTTPSECAMIRERLVAGTNAPIPDCPIHGTWTDDAEEFIPAPLRCNRCHRPMAGTTAYDGACECGGLIEAAR